MTWTWVTLGLVHLVATAAMTGLIWTIHVVHYPLFDKVGEATYQAFQEEHMSRISALLLAPWGVEVITAIALVAIAPNTQLRMLAIGGLVLVGLILGVTAFGAAPIHGRLVEGFAADLHERLLFWDLIRTILWTVRVIVAVAVVAVSVTPASL